MKRIALTLVPLALVLISPRFLGAMVHDMPMDKGDTGAQAKVQAKAKGGCEMPAQARQTWEDYAKILQRKFGLPFSIGKEDCNLHLKYGELTEVAFVLSAKNEDELDEAVIKLLVTGNAPLFPAGGLKNPTTPVEKKFEEMAARDGVKVYVPAGAEKDIFQGAVIRQGDDEFVKIMKLEKAKKNEFKAALNLIDGRLVLPSPHEVRFPFEKTNTKRVVIHQDENNPKRLVVWVDHHNQGFAENPIEGGAARDAVQTSAPNIYTKVDQLLKLGAQKAKGDGAAVTGLSGKRLEAYRNAFEAKMVETVPGGEAVVTQGKGGRKFVEYRVTGQDGIAKVIARTPVPAMPAKVAQSAIEKRAQGVAEKIIAGDDFKAKLAAIGAALKRGGEEKKLPGEDGGEKEPLPEKPDLVLKPVPTPKESVAAEAAKASGLKSGCGVGKTLGDYKSDLAEKRKGDSAKMSGKRLKAYERFEEAVKETETEYDKDPEARKVRDNPFKDDAWKNSQPAEVKAKARRDKKVAQAEEELQKELAQLGSEEAQKEKELSSEKEQNAAADKELKDQAAARIKELREDAAGGGGLARREWDENPESPLKAAKYVPEAQKPYVDAGMVKEYFKKEWAANSAKYEGNFKSCSDPRKVRLNNSGDIDECVKKHFAEWLKGEVKGKGGATTVPAKAETPKERMERLKKAQREKELNPPKAPPTTEKGPQP